VDLVYATLERAITIEFLLIVEICVDNELVHRARTTLSLIIFKFDSVSW